MPGWVQQGYVEYVRRLPRHCRLRLVEVPAHRRGANADRDRVSRLEGQALLGATPGGCYRVAMDESGVQYDTSQWAQNLEGWLQQGRDVALLVGGPDGLSGEVKDAADGCWSLSRLTLPHALVRVLVAEQLYRAWSVTANLPYHRG
jgi:23S rRNA (pseudouridine1915-N3)-methyltransferase